jgi:TonB family protein
LQDVVDASEICCLRDRVLYPAIYKGICPGAGAPPIAPDVAPVPQPRPQKIRVGGNVALTNLVSQVTPEYPEIAKNAHVSGTVLLHTVTGMDGTIVELEYVSGPPLLMKSAMDAVRQWRYKPTKLNGYPVEVDTTVTVVFKLGESDNGPVTESSPPPQQVPPIDPQLKADIERLINLPQMKQEILDSRQALFDQMRPYMIASLPDTPNRETILKTYFEKLGPLISSDDYFNQVVATHAKYFSDDDIKGMIAFYGDACGAALPEKSSSTYVGYDEDRLPYGWGELAAHQERTV